MKDKDYQKLSEKYYSGSSDLKEESELIKQQDSEGQDPWLAYVRDARVSAPEGLADRLWAESELSQIRNRPLWAYISSVAAGLVLLLIGWHSLRENSSGQSLAEKERLLQIALEMTDSDEESADVLYRDELITISLQRNEEG